MISIHALLAESDLGSKARQAMQAISIHALLAESDRTGPLNTSTKRRFLSTLSLRRATDDLQVPASVSKISIHALLAESDRLIPSLSTMLFDFYPRSPCGERLYANFSGFYWWIISIHALLAESDGCQRPCERPTTNFYPRSPCGERHIRANFCLLVYYFYPRSPCGERQPWTPPPKIDICISIHALLAESDYTAIVGTSYSKKFLSTLSLRRATPPLHI